MFPDTQCSVEIVFLSEGFREALRLSKQVDTIYKLMIQQLSKQSHYAYGLRAVKSVLTRSGSISRARDNDLSEEHVLTEGSERHELVQAGR